MLLLTKNKYDKINREGLCIGCGLCESIGKEKGYLMNLSSKGFYEPIRTKGRDAKVEKQISAVCPAINLYAPQIKDNLVWGNINAFYNVSSKDTEVRNEGSSGGGLSAMCIYLLENKIVDAILHIGKIEGETIENKLFVSRDRGAVIRNASSRYAPSRTFNELKDILDRGTEIFAFVGKPCDIAGIKNYLSVNTDYQNRIAYFFSFFCAGMPSYNATSQLLERANEPEPPYFLKYRGGGWPGYFFAKFKNDKAIKITYRESWGKVLGRQLHARCKICPDGIGMMADIVYADAWETKDGYPDFEEKEGVSLAIARTTAGELLLQKALNDGSIMAEPVASERIEKMQPYQYQRRLAVGYRILAVQFLTDGLLNFNGTGYMKLMRQYPIVKGLKNTLGTLKRFLADSRKRTRDKKLYHNKPTKRVAPE
ncbi:MAG: Coenzyme F420 hydrogenase/dehydrogenase, beta subunit C-terminal domain [Ginsengibacter sp.]